MRTSVPASCFATRNRENSLLLLRLVGSSCGFTWLDFCCCGSPGFLLRMPAPWCLLKRQRWLQFQLDLWKDLVSTEWLWPFLPDIYQSKRRWELKVVYLSKHSGPLCKHSAKLTAETGPLNAGQLWLQPLPQAQLWLESLVGAVVAVPAVLEQFGLHRLHCHWWDQHLI